MCSHLCCKGCSKSPRKVCTCTLQRSRALDPAEAHPCHCCGRGYSTQKPSSLTWVRLGCVAFLRSFSARHHFARLTGRLDGRLLRLVCYPFGVFLSCWLSSAFFAFLVTRFSGVSSRKRVSGGALRRPDLRAITEPIHLRRRKHRRLHATRGHGRCAASHAEAFRRFRPPARPYSHPPTLLCLPSYKGVRPAGARVHAVEANSATFVRLGVNVRPPPTPHLRLFTPCGCVLALAQCSHPPTHWHVQQPCVGRAEPAPRQPCLAAQLCDREHERRKARPVISRTSLDIIDDASPVLRNGRTTRLEACDGCNAGSIKAKRIRQSQKPSACCTHNMNRAAVARACDRNGCCSEWAAARSSSTSRRVRVRAP